MGNPRLQMHPTTEEDADNSLKRTSDEEIPNFRISLLSCVRSPAAMENARVPMECGIKRFSDL